MGLVTGLKSALTGVEADGIIVSVGLSPRMLKFCFSARGKQWGLDAWAKRRIINAVRFSQQEGATIIALTGQVGGGSLAQEIISTCEANPAMHGLELLSGNHLTAAMVVKASTERVQAHALEPRQMTVGIVGCYGSLGAAIASLMARGFSLAEGERYCRFLLRGGNDQDKADRLKQQLERYARDEITAEVITNDDRLVECDLVIVSTNLGKPHLFSKHFKKGAIVCDLAVPHAVDSSVLRDRTDVDVFLGGAVQAPGQNSDLVQYGFNFGMDQGLCFACMAEAEVAAVDTEAIPHLTKKMTLNPDKCVALYELAEANGFRYIVRRRQPRHNPWAFWRH